MSGGHYLHGTHASEQARLADLNSIINDRCLAEIDVSEGQSVVDFGSGLGQMSIALAERVGPRGRVVGIERDERQLAEAQRLVGDRRVCVEFRRGDVGGPPLREDEWGTFDLAHARFILEHVPDPLGVVRQMVCAVRPGGRIVLADDDHDVLRLWPRVPAFERMWQTVISAYLHVGNDPAVGRKLPALLDAAGARPVRATLINFGACAGEAAFEPLVSNLQRIVEGFTATVLDAGLLDERAWTAGLAELASWRVQPGAALWYSISFAEGLAPG